MINFFGVSWGLIALIGADASYVPASRAYESAFLNTFNEKQWATNSHILWLGTQVGNANPTPPPPGPTPSSRPLGLTALRLPPLLWLVEV